MAIFRFFCSPDLAPVADDEAGTATDRLFPDTWDLEVRFWVFFFGGGGGSLGALLVPFVSFSSTLFVVIAISFVSRFQALAESAIAASCAELLEGASPREALEDVFETCLRQPVQGLEVYRIGNIYLSGCGIICACVVCVCFFFGGGGVFGFVCLCLCFATRVKRTTSFVTMVVDVVD